MSKPKDVDSYIANSVKEARPILEALRRIIKSTIPKAEEGISWNVPFYKYHGELVGYAVYKSHVSFGIGAAVLQSEDQKMLEEEGYKTGKGTIQIKFDQKVPIAAIERLLKAKAKMNEAKKVEK
ncbi:MAG: iron chaperone [Candidatus Thorarchaeota archaeon]